MKTERQQDQDVAERLRRENLERVEAGGCAPPVVAEMPKDNEVSNLDNAITKARSEVDFALCRGPRAMEAREKRLAQIVCLLELAKHDHAATVAELRAEVERLRKSNELYSFAMNTAGIDELKRRADAAERRVGELEEWNDGDSSFLSVADSDARYEVSFAIHEGHSGVWRAYFNPDTEREPIKETHLGTFASKERAKKECEDHCNRAGNYRDNDGGVSYVY